MSGLDSHPYFVSRALEFDFIDVTYLPVAKVANSNAP